MSRIPAPWLKSILLTIYPKPAITRDEIIRATGLNPASVSQALQHLLSSGTVLKVGELKSSGGRRREVLKLNPEAGYFIAVDLETARIRYALTNLVGDIRYRWEQELEFGRGVDVADLLHGMEMVQRNLMEWQSSRLLAVGISCPGIIHENRRVTAVNLGWHKFPLAEKLKEATNLPLSLETACRAYVLAERWLGCAQRVDNCIYIEIGRGVGAGIVVDGRYLEGQDHMAGEFGHLTIDASAADPCHCGKRGCLEAIASSSGILRQYCERVHLSKVEKDRLRLGDVFECARENDPVAIAVIDRASHALGLGLSHLIVLFNPALIILGGDLLQGEDLLVPRISAALASHTPEFVKKTKVSVTNLGLDIGLKGAAFLAFHNAVSHPDLIRKLCAPVVETIAV